MITIEKKKLQEPTRGYESRHRGKRSNTRVWEPKQGYESQHEGTRANTMVREL